MLTLLGMSVSCSILNWLWAIGFAWLALDHYGVPLWCFTSLLYTKKKSIPLLGNVFLTLCSEKARQNAYILPSKVTKLANDVLCVRERIRMFVQFLFCSLSLELNLDDFWEFNVIFRTFPRWKTSEPFNHFIFVILQTGSPQVVGNWIHQKHSKIKFEVNSLENHRQSSTRSLEEIHCTCQWEARKLEKLSTVILDAWCG